MVETYSEQFDFGSPKQEVMIEVIDLLKEKIRIRIKNDGADPEDFVGEASWQTMFSDPPKYRLTLTYFKREAALR